VLNQLKQGNYKTWTRGWTMDWTMDWTRLWTRSLTAKNNYRTVVGHFTLQIQMNQLQCNQCFIFITC